MRIRRIITQWEDERGIHSRLLELPSSWDEPCLRCQANHHGLPHELATARVIVTLEDGKTITHDATYQELELFMVLTSGLSRSQIRPMFWGTGL